MQTHVYTAPQSNGYGTTMCSKADTYMYMYNILYTMYMKLHEHLHMHETCMFEGLPYVCCTFMSVCRLQSHQPTLDRGKLEELSILFSLKDLLLPQLHNADAISTFVLLLSDLFPSCDVAELLAHERQLQEGLAARAVENREAGTSARESRAASAMMVVRDESRHPSEGLWHYLCTYTYTY